MRLEQWSLVQFDNGVMEFDVVIDVETNQAINIGIVSLLDKMTTLL